MTKSLLLFLIFSLSLPVMSQDQEYPLTQEEEYYEGYQVNPEAYPEEEYIDIERQEQEAFEYIPNEDYIPEEESQWNNTYEEYPPEEYPIEEYAE
jgi:hypothetical protein